MSIPTITTCRLVLCAFTEEDVAPLHHILGEEGMLRYFPNLDPPSRERVQRLIAAQLKHWEDHGYGWWALKLRSDDDLSASKASLARNALIGWAGLHYLPETEETEVAYLLDKACWGHGLATEAARASVGYGFEDLELECIVGIVHPENVASRRVLEKSGLSFIERAQYFGMDVYRYSIERPSWLALQGHG